METKENNIFDRIGLEFNESEIQYKTQGLSKKELQESDISDYIEESVLIDDEITDGRWAVVRNSIYYPCDDTANNLATGIYQVGYAIGIGVYLKKINIITDELVDLPEDTSEEILKHIKEFWALKKRFHDNGFLHKRGIMVYGPAGSGKTCTVIKVLKNIVAQQGIAIIGDYPGEDHEAVQMIRQIEPDRPIVLLYEDIDEVIRRYGDRTLTAMLDGEGNVDNILFLATTNYPERLPPRLLNRPSRFDVVKYIGFPDAKAREAYLNAKVDLAPSEMTVWVKVTHGLSIPHIKELIILVKVYGKELKESVEILKSMYKLFSRMSKSELVSNVTNIEIKLEEKDVKVEPIIKIPPLEQPVINIKVPKDKLKRTITKITERDARGLPIAKETVEVFEEDENNDEEAESND